MALRATLILLIAALVAFATAAFLPARDDPGSGEARQAARQWVAIGQAQPPRRDGGEWEVGVLRPDGSLVEVTVGRRLELLELVEELAPGRRPAADELWGPERVRTARAALAVVPNGRVLSVERDRDGELEVTDNRGGARGPGGRVRPAYAARR